MTTITLNVGTYEKIKNTHAQQLGSEELIFIQKNTIQVSIENLLDCNNSVGRYLVDVKLEKDIVRSYMVDEESYYKVHDLLLTRIVDSSELTYLKVITGTTFVPDNTFKQTGTLFILLSDILSIDHLRQPIHFTSKKEKFRDIYTLITKQNNHYTIDEQSFIDITKEMGYDVQ